MVGIGQGAVPDGRPRAPLGGTSPRVPSAPRWVGFRDRLRVGGGWVDPMSTYHLQARLFEGSLAAPTRNELLSHETDDWENAVTCAHELTDRGFVVWVYDHGRRPQLAFASDYRVVAEFSPAADRVR